MTGPLETAGLFILGGAVRRALIIALSLMLAGGPLLAQGNASSASATAGAIRVATSSGLLTTNADLTFTAFTTASAGQYQVMVTADLTTAGTGGSFSIGTITDDGSGTTNTFATGTQALNGTIHNTQVNQNVVTYSAAGKAIQIHISFTTPTGSPVVSYIWTIVKVQ